MDVDYDHLVGQQFTWGDRDCFGLIKRFYSHNFDIELHNFARPSDWQPDKLFDLFTLGAESEGFVEVTNYVRNIRPGDVLLMALRSTKINHCGVYVGNGQFLHHYHSCLSKVDPFSGSWRKRCLKVLRHRDNSKKQWVDDSPIDIVDYYPEPMRTKLREARDKATTKEAL